jgi:formylglycine-generating enzyme required for sulfatase activity
LNRSISSTAIVLLAFLGGVTLWTSGRDSEISLSRDGENVLILSQFHRTGVPAALLAAHLRSALSVQYLDFAGAGDPDKIEAYTRALEGQHSITSELLRKERAKVDDFIRFYCAANSSPKTCEDTGAAAGELKRLGEKLAATDGQREVAFMLNRTLGQMIDELLARAQISSLCTRETQDTVPCRVLRSYVKPRTPDMKFVVLAPGEFGMGENQIRVKLTRGFELQSAPISQLEWATVMGTNPAYFSEKRFCPETYLERDGFGLCPGHPEESISWSDVQSYIAKLNWQDSKYRYRLPTEAEWEYAARAGSRTAYAFGENAGRLGEYAWYKENSGGQTHSVALKKPNAWGLYDMHGNVWQWVEDRYAADLVAPAVDPAGANEGPFRVIRGGNWFFPAPQLRSAIRFNFIPDGPGVRCRGLGSRLARTPK